MCSKRNLPSTFGHSLSKIHTNLACLNSLWSSLHDEPSSSVANSRHIAECSQIILACWLTIRLLRHLTTLLKYWSIFPASHHMCWCHYRLCLYCNSRKFVTASLIFALTAGSCKCFAFRLWHTGAGVEGSTKALLSLEEACLSHWTCARSRPKNVMGRLA